MKYTVVILAFLVISCIKIKHEFAVYDVDVMRDAYKRNHVKAFTIAKFIDGKTYRLDSTVLDPSGNTVKKFMGFSGDKVFVYDSLGRLISESYRGDTYRDFRILYEQLPEYGTVIQRWIDVTGNDSTLAYVYTTKYNSTLDTILSRSTLMIGDTTLTIRYKYRNRRLVEIGPDNQKRSFKYSYDHMGQLERITTYLDDKPFKIEFISPGTGLADSAANLSNLPDSITRNGFDLNKFKLSKRDVTYYSYFK